MGLAPSTSYSYRVFAVDAAGNNGPYSPVATTTTQLGPSGLVAAYGFNEGSGTTTADASGNGLTGTLNGAAWTTLGKFGNALSFNGSSNYVDLGNPTPLKLTGSMTWSAWIYATANPADDGQIIAKSGGTNGTLGSQFKTSPDTGPHTFGVAVSGDGITNAQRYSTSVRSLNTWYFVTGVYDATNRKLDVYVNGQLDDGVLRGTVPASQFDPATNVNIGRRSGGFYFAGRIDEVRIYNRALSAPEIQADMNSAVTSTPDTQAPTAPTGLTATAAGSTQVNLSWPAATDNVGVSGYRVERCQGANCTTFAQIATPTATSYSDTGLTAGTSYSYRVRAVDAAGNAGGYSPVASATTTAPGHRSANRSRHADGDGGQLGPDRPDVVGRDRQHRCYRLPGRAVPGDPLHRLRADRDTERHLLQRHGTDAEHELQLSRTRGRCGRERRCVLADRECHDALCPERARCGVRFQRGNRDDDRRRVRQRDHRKPDRHDVDDRRQVRERPRLQRDDKLRQPRQPDAAQDHRVDDLERLGVRDREPGR